MAHLFPVTVYYEDTDLAGIVYYANYLKFIERARSTWVRELGIDQRAMKEEGQVFAIRRVEADYLSPARFEDSLMVETSLSQISGAKITMYQRVLRGEEVLFTAFVTLVCLGASGAPIRLPQRLREAFDHGRV